MSRAGPRPRSPLVRRPVTNLPSDGALYHDLTAHPQAVLNQRALRPPLPPLAGRAEEDRRDVPVQVEVNRFEAGGDGFEGDAHDLPGL